MPQMMPLNWFMLFLFFLISMILFFVMNYYIISNKIPYSSLYKKITNKSFFWKW
uniref:ATP synthase F0 subunit 8 n=1 Tax=Pachymantis bicingulata TaxID=1689247 RepID=UPI0022FD76F2|nr:ATP synthase F0 subunit 8 [Pachymantis bicingulata]UIX55381.1 ATP synthase F0 subunit 8 [Pachymantis bicingulata]